VAVCSAMTGAGKPELLRRWTAAAVARLARARRAEAAPARRQGPETWAEARTVLEIEALRIGAAASGARWAELTPALGRRLPVIAEPPVREVPVRSVVADPEGAAPERAAAGGADRRETP
jgi:hypothetical protein